MSDIWDWIYDSIEQFRLRRDPERYSMAHAFNQGMQILQTQPRQALALLEQVREKAEALHEPWWALLCDHWRCQILIHYTGQIDAAQELVSRSLATVGGDPAFREFPQRVCLRDDELHVLQMVDPVGYDSEIQAGCDYIDAESFPNSACLHCGRCLRIDSLIVREEFDRATALSLEGLKTCATKAASHYVPAYYAALCRIAAARQDWGALSQCSAVGETYYGLMGSEHANVELLAWNAAALRLTGHVEGARAAYRKARSAARRRLSRRTNGFYDAVALYHVAGGDFLAAYVVRGIQLANTSGAPYVECRCRSERVRLLQRMNKPHAEESALLSIAAHKLRDPSRVLNAVTKSELPNIRPDHMPR
ncbi:MAG: hypothetical protein ACLQVD_05280 [Capsulimonadaceae bacterium]